MGLSAESYETMAIVTSKGKHSKHLWTYSILCTSLGFLIINKIAFNSLPNNKIFVDDKINGPKN